MFSTGFQSIFLIVVAALWLGAIWRWRHTPESHPDFRARRDVARFLFAFLLTLAVVLVRSGLSVNSTGFWVSSVVLLLLSIIVLTFVWRLFNAYRQIDTK